MKVSRWFSSKHQSQKVLAVAGRRFMLRKQSSPIQKRAGRYFWALSIMHASRTDRFTELFKRSWFGYYKYNTFPVQTLATRRYSRNFKLKIIWICYFPTILWYGSTMKHGISIFTVQAWSLVLIIRRFSKTINIMNKEMPSNISFKMFNRST